VTEVGTFYGRLSCGWLGVVLALQADLSGRLSTMGQCVSTAGRSSKNWKQQSNRSSSDGDESSAALTQQRRQRNRFLCRSSLQHQQPDLQVKCSTSVTIKSYYVLLCC